MHEREALNVLVLYNITERWGKGLPEDLIAEQSVVEYAEAIAAVLAELGYRTVSLPMKDRIEVVLGPCPPAQYVVFNLAEGFEGRLFEEARIALALEALGYCFTGSDGLTLAIAAHKARAKARLTAAGVPTPAARLFHHPDQVPNEALGSPLIVKPLAEDAGHGISASAVVETAAALRERVAHIVERFSQAALVEQFIIGREFSISVWGNAPPTVLPVAEVDFSAFPDPLERIVSYDAKWIKDSFPFGHTPVTCPASTTPAEERCLADVSLRAYEVLGCRDYARIDIRLAHDGTPYVLEVNPNPDLSYDAGFFRSVRATGYTYAGMAEYLLSLALQRRGADDLSGYGTRW